MKRFFLLLMGAQSAPRPPCFTCLKQQLIEPMLVVYVKYQGSRPMKSLQWVQDQIVGPPPSLFDMVAQASWGQESLDGTDVDFFDFESETDPASWGGRNSAAVVPAITSQNTYQAELARQGKVYNRILIILPGESWVGEGLPLWEYSVFGGRALTWQTFAHEIGHNWGLGHAGAWNWQKAYNWYHDFAIMSYDRPELAPDFTGIARYNVGWIPMGQVASFTDTKIVAIRSLNEGPYVDDNAALLMTIPCPTCKSTEETVGGDLFLSLRVSSPTSAYGPTDKAPSCKEKDTFRDLKLDNRVHVHFQRTHGPLDTLLQTELWTTLNTNDIYQVPDSRIWIKICSFAMAPSPAPTAHPPVSDNFVQSATNVIACPAQSSLITDSKGCEAAAFKLGKRYNQKQVWEEVPPGCVSLGDDEFYFNAPYNEVGAASESYRMVCKLEEPTRLLSSATSKAVVAVSSCSAADAEARCAKPLPTHIPGTTTTTTTQTPGANMPCPSFVTDLGSQCDKYCQTQSIQGIRFRTGGLSGKGTQICGDTYCTCQCRAFIATTAECAVGSEREAVLGGEKICWYTWCSDRSRFTFSTTVIIADTTRATYTDGDGCDGEGFSEDKDHASTTHHGTTSMTTTISQAALTSSTGAVITRSTTSTPSTTEYTDHVTSGSPGNTPGANMPCPSFITDLSGECEDYCVTQSIQGIMFKAGGVTGKGSQICGDTYCTCQCRAFIPTNSECPLGFQREVVIGEDKLCYYNWCSDRSRFTFNTETDADTTSTTSTDADRDHGGNAHRGTTSMTTTITQATLTSSTGATTTRSTTSMTATNKYIDNVPTDPPGNTPGANMPCPSSITDLNGECESYCETQSIQGILFRAGGVTGHGSQICGNTYCTCQCRTIIPTSSECTPGFEREAIIGEEKLCYYDWCSDRSRFTFNTETDADTTSTTASTNPAPTPTPSATTSAATPAPESAPAPAPASALAPAPAPALAYPTLVPAPAPASAPARVPVVILTLKVQNVNYAELVQTESILEEFNQKLREAIAQEAGVGILPIHVIVVLSAGSVMVESTITPPSNVEVTYVQDSLALASSNSLASTIVSKISVVDGISSVSTGSITVTDVSEPMATTAAIPGTQPEPTPTQDLPTATPTAPIETDRIPIANSAYVNPIWAFALSLVLLSR